MDREMVAMLRIEMINSYRNDVAPQGCSTTTSNIIYRNALIVISDEGITVPTMAA
jgi:hypothetical protein